MNDLGVVAARRSTFYVAGGTLAFGAASYVERSADTALYTSILAGNYCFVLNSRQMGKSSLCVRTMKRLREAGVKTAFVDLTRLGNASLTSEQWYAGIALEIGRSMGLRGPIDAYWTAHAHVSPLQRLFGALRDVALEQIEAPIAVFIDEIDATRTLSFSADEFFAGIRECFNRRAQDAVYERLSFCLLGVAVASDLIADPASTPFNIGERIYLRDFTLEESMSLSIGMVTGERSLETAEVLLKQVFYWTNGHPFLTQSLCALISADSSLKSRQDVDAIVRRELLDPLARETNINLADVSNRVLNSDASEPDPPKFRANLLTAYESAWKGNALPDDESNRVAAALKLSGLLRTDGARLVIRNRIYRSVFDRRWILDHMPNQEIRRQRRSFWRGVIRTAGLAILVLAAISTLAIHDRRLAIANAELAARAGRAERKAEYQAYVADVNFMRTAFADRDYPQVARLLQETKSNPARGIEWSYWNTRLHEGPALPVSEGAGRVAISPDGHSVAVTLPRVGGGPSGAGSIYSYPDFRKLYSVPARPLNNDIAYVSGRWVWFNPSDDHRTLRAFDAVTNQKIDSIAFGGKVIEAFDVRLNGLALHALLGKPGHGPDVLVTLSAWPLRVQRAFRANGGQMSWAVVSSGGKFAVIVLEPGPNESPSLSQNYLVVRMDDGKIVDQFGTTGDVFCTIGISRDGRYIAPSYWKGRFVVRDAKLHRTVIDRRIFLSEPRGAMFSADDKRLLLTADGSGDIFDIPSGQLICSQPASLDTAALAPDGKTFCIAFDGVRVHDVRPAPAESAKFGKPDLDILGFDRDDRPVVQDGETIEALDPDSLHPAGRFDSNLVTGSVEHGGYVVRAANDRHVLFRLNEIHSAPNSLAATDDGARVAIIDPDGRTLGVFERSGRPLWRYGGGRDLLMRSVWSPDGGKIAMAGWNKDIMVFDSRTGRLLWRFVNDDEVAWVMAFSPVGERLVWVDLGVLHIADLRNGTTVRVPGGVFAPSIHFSRDGTRLVAGYGDGTVRIWDPATWAEMLRLGSGTAKLNYAGFDRAERHIYTADETGILTSYPIDLN